MPNLNYKRSRTKEYKALHDLEKEGYLAFRMAGSHGISDVIGIKPCADKCADANHFEVRFIQIKVSKNISKLHPFVKKFVPTDTPIGLVNVEFHTYRINERPTTKLETGGTKTRTIKRKA